MKKCLFVIALAMAGVWVFLGSGADGTVQAQGYSPPSGMVDAGQSNSLQLHPNPKMGVAILTWSSTSGVPEVFAIYKNGRKFTVGRFSPSAFCPAGDMMLRDSAGRGATLSDYMLFKFPSSASGWTSARLLSAMNALPDTLTPLSSSAQGVVGVAEPPVQSAMVRQAAPCIDCEDERHTEAQGPAERKQAPARLDRPGNFDAALQGDGSILVRWSAPQNGGDAWYRVRQRNGGGKYKIIAREVTDGGPLDADPAAGRIAYRQAASELRGGDTYLYSVRAIHPNIKKSKWTPGSRVRAAAQ
jgi:hypothetical protein